MAVSIYRQKKEIIYHNCDYFFDVCNQADINPSIRYYGNDSGIQMGIYSVTFVSVVGYEKNTIYALLNKVIYFNPLQKKTVGKLFKA